MLSEIYLNFNTQQNGVQNGSPFQLLLLYLCVAQNEAVTALKKSRQQYFQRCGELEKAKAITAKTVDDPGGIKTLDKRRKSKDEAQTKARAAILKIPPCIFGCT